jgi:hypothetical protein
VDAVAVVDDDLDDEDDNYDVDFIDHHNDYDIGLLKIQLHRYGKLTTLNDHISFLSLVIYIYLVVYHYITQLQYDR